MMPAEFWGASELLYIAFPGRLSGMLLLLLYGGGVAALIYRYRRVYAKLSLPQWGWITALSVAAFLTSQLLPLPFSFDTPSIWPTAASLTVLAAIPILLAGVVLPPAGALLVGLAGGLGAALGEWHQFLHLFNMGFTAVFIAILMQQNYIGRVYRWLREPVVAGLLGAVLLSALTGLTLFASGPPATLSALDWALVLTGANIWPRLLEGLVGGLVMMIILRIMPDLRPKRPLIPSPTQRSLQKRLNINYVGFVAVLILLSLLVLSSVAITVSKRLVVSQMAHNTKVTLATLPETVATEAEMDKIRTAKTAQESMIVRNENNEIVGDYPSAESPQWRYEPDELRSLFLAQPDKGTAYRGWGVAPYTRYIVVEIESGPWTVVTGVPFTAVLQQAWDIGWPLLLVMLLSAGLFYANVLVMGRDITNPINDIVEASRTVAAGGNWTPTSHPQRDDEIGQLQYAFAQMQRSMRKRLNELSLLLSVSYDVSTGIDIDQGITAILRGALRGTGAVGARAVVVNPSGGSYLTFGEGTAAVDMAQLDRLIMTKLRHISELMLATPEQIKATLGLDENFSLPIPALLAIPLYSHDRFQGILWLGFRQAHSFDLTERNLLSTLATQAAVLVENTRLYSTAESGRRRLAAVLASTSDAVIVTDPTERILLINRAAERIFNLKANQVRNLPVVDVIQMASLADALTGQDERTRNLEVMMENDKVYSAIASTIFSNEGQVFGRVAVLRDITYLKEIDAMKSDFVATVSHDLRSPLTFMRGYATMLPMVGELTDKQGDYIEKILGGIDQMARLVDDLLDLGRIEAGVDLAQEMIEVRPLLTDIATEYWQHAHLAGIKLDVDVADDVTAISGDTSLIRQALTNLIGNGLKYAPNSGAMTLGASQANGEIIFRVKDNGPGISKDDQIRLFEKFYRVQEKGTEKVKGSGLGLAIVKSIAERHGGRVWCQSQRGKGTTFYMAVPNYTNDSQPGQNGTAVNG
ncbi:MAG: PAS domain-containing protein [Chloroflexi bacterium]|nr:PAS domain-containing protein [Chloroflexota bacterium]